VTRYEEERSRFRYSDAAQIPETRPAVLVFLKEHGFDEADIDRVAMQASVDTLASLESLALKHEIRREEIFREVERRRERREQQSQSVVHSKINGRVQALVREPEGAAPPPEPSP
jgi:hypothetical protein